MNFKTFAKIAGIVTALTVLALSTGHASADEPSSGLKSNVQQCTSHEDCHDYNDMRTLANHMVPYVREFANKSYPRIANPKVYYVAHGKKGKMGCVDSSNRQAWYSDKSYEYCGTEKAIYMGQDQLWAYYYLNGDAAAFVALAHEWGHHIQRVKGVKGSTLVQENQADCFAGAWTAYAITRRWLEQDDIDDIDSLFYTIASHESPTRSHGLLKERAAAFSAGVKGGLRACNSFTPSTPLLS